MTTEWLNPPHRRWIARITIPHSDDDETVVQWGTWTRWGARRKTRSALALIRHLGPTWTVVCITGAMTRPGCTG